MNQKSKKTAINPTREQDFSEWYQQVVKSADLAESSPVRGCMIIKPHGYSIWENIQKRLDNDFKKTGHKNVYFPLLIPLKYLEEEAAHVDGFAKECAVVTHRKLVEKDGKLIPDGELAEPYIIRPTSETVIGEAFSRWINSYRDLPLKINQWANVMRWEMRPRIFLRTAEFLWQEGHTAHATEKEAMEETMTMLEVYADFVQDYLAIPVIQGEKTINEKFPGAVSTFTIEAMMQDKKALQAGTSHYLGQNFSKAQNIRFQGEDENEHFAHTTSWGVSTRLIGGLIMTHADDNGLVIPPKIASTHIIIVPVARKEEDVELVENFVTSLENDLSQKRFNNGAIGVEVDRRDLRGGEKYWDNIKKGHPIILEIGPRDIKNNKVFMTRRDQGNEHKTGIDREEFIENIEPLLQDIQNNIFQKALAHMKENIVEVDNLKELSKVLKRKDTKLALTLLDDNDETQKYLKEYQASFRCIPLQEPELPEGSKCLFTGKPVKKRVLVGKSY